MSCQFTLVVETQFVKHAYMVTLFYKNGITNQHHRVDVDAQMRFFFLGGCT